ncbi:hypothetical protein EST38_g9415 [Candolleomyces aberdarensis]|uniref:Nucleolar protein 9 n=1 Tax=Candolleomyces aberdarensis TaxID=2316362 RepID=A0A4Q2DBP5_9AGAR|nr:hypothetical protein EST38_g9415 [Candolleomyces aberdarensis]
MPKEHRKRGKKHKKSQQEEEWTEPAQQEYHEPEPQLDDAGPSWIRPAAKDPNEFNPEAPFGYVDADVKAYFRTVDLQMRDWQDNKAAEEGDEDVDPNEERRLFFVAALNEMREKEKLLATDPDCSVVLERMLHSMDDFVRRVFFDSLAGSFEVLSKHRFGSHVVQTLFTVAGETIGRETRGVLPSVPTDADVGELRTCTQLVLDACEELLPVLPSLIIDPFASHVLRAILLLLSPSSASTEEALRSKKSSSWKAKQGAMKSVFEEKGKGRADGQKIVPPQFSELSRRFVQQLQESHDGNEIRAMAASSVASPCLKIFLEIEADQDLGDERDSLMDRVTMGLITSTKTGDGDTLPEPSDYVGTLLRDPTSSHLLETIVSRSPPKAFDLAWQLYFNTKLARLAAHPVANFVVAKALERLSPEQITDAYAELKDVWHRSIQTSRTGVLRAFAERVASLGIMADEVSQSVFSAFGFEADAEKTTLVLCILSVLTKEDYESALKAKSKKPPPATQSHKHHRGPKEIDPLQYKTQGSILVQALIKMPESHNKFILDAIHDLSMEHKIAIGHDATGSRIYDVLLESPTVPPRVKRQFVMDFIGHYHELVDDRIGSRVGDRCWSFSDTYLKEKIARSLMPHESQLAGSFYGKFFARNLNLYTLKRRPDEWRNMQSQKKQSSSQGQGQAAQNSTTQQQQPTAPPVEPVSQTTHSKKEQKQSRKRSKPSDEIDELFDQALGKKVKKAALEGLDDRPKKSARKEEGDKEEKGAKGKKGGKDVSGLDAVLGAIKAAPKHEEGRPKKKHKRS